MKIEDIKTGRRYKLRDDLKDGLIYGTKTCNDEIEKMDKEITADDIHIEYKWFTVKESLWQFTPEMIERELDMKKEDLKVGYVVELRNGELYMLMETAKGNLNFSMTDFKWMQLDSYTVDLYNIYDIYNDDEYDIMKVYGLPHRSHKLLEISKEDRDLLWERKEKIKEMTLEEVIKELGYDIKIIK